MATSKTELKGILDEIGVKYQELRGSAIGFFYGTKNYVDVDGDKALKIIIELNEDGEYIKFFSPKAFVIEGPNVPAFLQACMEVQWKTKLIQFEYDSADGEIRPIIEFPIEDSTLTTKQVLRCIQGMVSLVDEYAPVLMKAKETGVVDFPVEVPPPDMMNGMMAMLMQAARSGQLTPEQRAMLQSMAGAGDNEPPSEL